MLLPPGFSGRTQARRCSWVTAPRGVLWFSPLCLACCPAVPAAHPHPAVPSHGGGWFILVWELRWALAILFHCHWGMRQLKASGNRGFMDVSQRPGQAPICFPGRVGSPRPRPRRLPSPRTAHRPLQLHLCGEDPLLSEKTAAPLEPWWWKREAGPRGCILV